MTRKEEIEKQAFAVYPIIMETLISLSADHEEVKQDCNQFLRKAYINGIKWADKTMLDKVCEWLKENLSYSSKPPYQVIEDLRKAMED